MSVKTSLPLMQQAVIVAEDRFEIRSTPVPALQDAGDILVRTALSGICSGDLMPWYLARKIGTVLGHEVVGHVEAVGQTVEHLREGDLVFFHHHAPCGVCPECLRQAPVHCETWRKSKLDPGGMAERIRVPAVNVRGDTFAVNDVTPEQAVFIEPLGCSIKAFQRLQGHLDLVNARGAVVGCGIMGLLNLAVARAFGVREMVAVEPDPARQERARSFGAKEVLGPGEAEQSLSRQLDFVVIGPGFPEVIQQSLCYVRNAGTALLFAPTAEKVLTSLDLGDLYFREVSLVPSYSCGPRATRMAYELLRCGWDPEKIITHRFPLTEIQQAYDTARQGGAVLKVVVTF
jgi:L-iditol 2-dehydrogenase